MWSAGVEGFDEVDVGIVVCRVVVEGRINSCLCPVGRVYEILCHISLPNAITGIFGIEDVVLYGNVYDGEFKVIGLADFSCLDVDFDDAELGSQIGVDTITVDVVDSFTACDGFGIDGADVDDVAVGLYQVDIGVAIDYHESFGLLAPADVGDIGV